MPKTKSTSSPAVKAPEKPPQSECREILEACSKRILVLSTQLEGLETFCSATDEGKQELYDFSYALAALLGPMALEATSVFRQLESLVGILEGQKGGES